MPSALLADEVLHVLVVLLADVLDQLAAKQGRTRRERPRLRERLRVFDDVLDLQVAEIGARDALDYLHVGRVRDTRLVEPGDVVLSDRLHDERVALPVTDRVAEPRGDRARVVSPPVEEDLAPDVRAAFVDDDDQ